MPRPRVHSVTIWPSRQRELKLAVGLLGDREFTAANVNRKVRGRWRARWTVLGGRWSNVERVVIAMWLHKQYPIKVTKPTKKG
jgi:hypothetical protein